MKDYQKSDLFEKFGFDNSNKWILLDEDFQNFFEWFAENITEVNFLTDLENREYEIINEKKEILNDSEIREELNKFESKYEDILKYSDQDVMLLKLEVDRLQTISDSQDILKKDLNENHLQHISHLNQIQTDLVGIESELNQVANDCLEKSEILSEHEKSNQQKINSLNLCYSQKYNPPLFMHEMPIDTFNLKCDQFLKYLDICMKKNFKVLDSMNEFDLLDSSDEFLVKMETAKERNVVAQIKMLEEKTNVLGRQFMLDRIDYQHWRTMNLSSIKDTLSCIESGNEHENMQLEVLKEELAILVNENIDQQFQIILFEFNRNRKEKAIERLDNAFMISNIASTFFMIAEMVWILMQLDVDKLNNKVDISEEMFHKTQICDKRIRIMQDIQSTDNNSFYDTFNEYLSQLIGNCQEAHKDQLHSMRNLFNELSNMEQNLSKIKSRNHFKDYDELMEICHRYENLLHDFVYNGPTCKPYLLDPKYLKVIQEKIMICKNIRDELDQSKKSYVANCLEPYNNDKYLRLKENLWIYFLMEPKKIVYAIEEVTKAAANKNKTASFKTVGIKRKQDL